MLVLVAVLALMPIVAVQHQARRSFHVAVAQSDFKNYLRIEHKKKAWHLVSSEPMRLGNSEQSFRCHLSATIRLVSLAEAQC